ncbi:glycosyltransferase family 2 protein [Bradyrhizobium guangdongense]|uniref:glycosyltransferase family 2 protein n=1 Tax=Bradyrhizobium guangdongense TaxID=1325090 RepID=UPI001127106F|nr:glycosyltransferase family 2 protein [Bradyrhizobium guangdongense]TPQ38692.1 glycosyltransferase family 2 protein [Bradyrhizobium guangdongense]
MISVVIPALNEERGISDTVKNIATVLTTANLIPFEIIVVDDGSTDATGRLASEAGAKVLRHPHNVGYGRSLKKGIEAASHDMIAICDADSTYPASAIPDLVHLYQDGFDMAVGERHGPHYRQSALKMPLRALLRFLVEWTAGRRIPDINSGLRVFGRTTAMEYFPHLCDTFSFTTSMTLAYMMTRRFVTYHKIDYFERSGSSKVRLFRDSLKTLQYIVEAIVYYNPLKIFLLTSLICIAVAVVMMLVSLSFSIVTGIMLSIGIAMVSVIMLGIGMLAVLLKQIMDKA